MSKRAPPGDTPHGPETLHQLARDWIALWHSELAALAVDREAQETWHTLLALWAAAADTMLAALPRGLPDGGWPAGPGRPAPAPRSAPAPAAPDPRDAELARLAAHIAELERRIAELERERDGKRRR